MPDLNNSRVFKTDYAGKELIVEIGKYAEQANGACLVRCGDTAVHVSVCMSETAREGMDFFPLPSIADAYAQKSSCSFLSIEFLFFRGWTKHLRCEKLILVSVRITLTATRNAKS